MSRQTPECPIRNRLGILLVIILLCLCLSIGIAYGRYRAQSVDNLPFVSDELEMVYLGRDVSADGEVDTQPADWVQENGVYAMEFLVCNGSSETKFAERDQEVSLSLLASGALLNGEEAVVELIVPTEDGEETFIATVQPILKGSSYETKFGDGWVFRFLDKDEEMTWTLNGGELSMLQAKITLADAKFVSDCQLQISVTGEAAE